MKTFIFLTLIFCSILNLQSQNVNDSIKLNWATGVLKYYEYGVADTMKGSNGSISMVLVLNTDYFDKQGNKLSKEDFIKLYGFAEINQINDEIKEIKEKNTDASKNSYTEIIRAADNYYFEKKYKEALINYEKAIEIKPNEEYPKIQIEQLKKLINDN